MSDRLFKVLNVLKAFGQARAVQIHKKMGSRNVVTAVNNSLNQLVRLGFASRQRDGRTWIYTCKWNPEQ